MSILNKIAWRKRMDKRLGVIKEIDKLGRIVIPKEIRERFLFKDIVEIVITDSGVLLQNPGYKLIKIEDIEDKND